MHMIKNSPELIVFNSTLRDSLANAIRRYLFHVPVLAIDSVEISKNDSALYDETLAHRLGLVPLVAPKNIPKGKEFKLALSSKGEGFVYSSSLKGDLTPAYNKIPLTLLDKGQEIGLTAIAALGQGSTHAKFSPGMMAYREVMKVKVEKGASSDIAEICPKHVFSSANGKVDVDDALACDNCGLCVDYDAKQDKSLVHISPSGDLRIQLESFGQIPPKDLFKKSLAALKTDLEAVAKALSKAK